MEAERWSGGCAIMFLKGCGVRERDGVEVSLIQGENSTVRLVVHSHLIRAGVTHRDDHVIRVISALHEQAHHCLVWIPRASTLR